jgi:catechol 2,3-dioxygenase-like lactoylglutathione lyase family enzyme
MISGPPNIRSDSASETRDFFTELLGFDVAMDLGWVVTVASPTNPSAQLTIVSNDDPAAPGISVEVDDVDAVHSRAAERGRPKLRADRGQRRRGRRDLP